MPAVRVLIVDDEPGILDLVSHILAKSGYDVIAASNGEEALGLIEAKRPVDLLISDVLMPGMQGPQLVEAVRQSSPSTRFMLMSAYPDTQVPDGARVLAKPFLPRDLVAAVEHTLADAAGARESLTVETMRRWNGTIGKTRSSSGEKSGC